MRRTSIAIALFIGAGAPLRLSAQDTTAIARALDAGYAQFTRAYANRWPDTVAAVYAEDAVYLAPGQEVVRGRAAIRANFAAFLTARTGPGPVVTFDIVERRYGRDLVHELGYFRMGPAGSDPATLRRGGKFTVVWGKQRDGSWKIISDNYSELPPPPAATPGPAPSHTPE